MEIIKIEDENLIPKVTKVLSAGGIVIYPTETCYGVGVDATNPNAVEKILKYKRRPEGKAISIGVDSINMADKYVEINNKAKSLYTNFLPGPITIVSKSKGNTDRRLESELGNLGIRIPNYNKLLEIITVFGKPITTTSANSSGKKTPYIIDDILNNISKKQEQLIDLIIDAGELPKNPPSTVIDTTTDDLAIYRTGQINPVELTLLSTKKAKSEEDIIQIGYNILKEYNSNIILLNGELGSGKTHFTKGIARSLNINQVIKSPTYNYINEYKLENGGKLIHFDAWRIQSKEDLTALGFYSWLEDNKNTVVIEWPTVISNLDNDIFESLENYLYIDIIKTNELDREVRIYKKK
jgi:L-threonylcarbamoyladenylate synthase